MPKPSTIGRSSLLLCCAGALACSNQSIKVLDTPIEATITDPEEGATLPAGVSRTARARVDVGDNDPAGVQAVWLVDGGEACASAAVSADGVSSCDFAPPVGRFDLTLEAVDAQGELATDSVRLEGVADDDADPDAPSAPRVSLTPDPATTTDHLVAVPSGSVSPDGSPVSYRYAWTVDGVAHTDTDGTDDTVDAVHTARDQSWTVTVTPSASGTDGPPASATVAIRNSPPDAPTVVITPDRPSAGRDALQCVVSVDATDVDGDALSYSMSWTVDGAAFPGGDDSGGEDSGLTGLATTTWPDDTIPAESLTSGEWSCAVLPHDGTDAGPTASATVTVEASFPSACPDGNCALEFDGIDDYVEVPHDSTLDVATTGLTVEAWLFYASIETDCMTAVRKGVSSSPTYAYWLHKNGGPADSLHWSSWPAFTCTSWSAVRAGQWVHYAGVWDPSSGTVRTYVNGTEFCSVAPTSAIQQNAEPLRIGIDWDWGCPMHGVIDEVRISRVPRYSGSFTPSTTHTVDADTMALYTFDAYTGSTLYDRSGNGNHGTIDGATWTTSNAP